MDRLGLGVGRCSCSGETERLWGRGPCEVGVGAM